jgi:flagellar hook-basal body complex protein FliE
MHLELLANVRPLEWKQLEIPETVPAVPAAKSGSLEANLPALSEGVSNGGFGALLAQSIQGLNDAQAEVGAQVQSFIQGQGPNVHTVMLNLEKANLSLEFAVQVRNKAMDAYNEIMHLQM